MKTSYKSEAAQVAALLKAELKEKFPTTKFSVRSETYAGGDSVHISYDKASNAPAAKDVEALTYKFQAGHFDGMTDCYEYTNRTKGPTAKFIFVRADYPSTVEKAVRDRLGWTAGYETYKRELESELVAQGY